jgi:hypothetical protein
MRAADMKAAWKLSLWWLFSAGGSLCSEVIRLGHDSFDAYLEAHPLALVACKYSLCQEMTYESYSFIA